MNFSIFTVFLKNRNINSKMKRSKVTDCAALKNIFNPSFYFNVLAINLRKADYKDIGIDI